MSIKIAVTVVSCDAAVHVGGDVERVTSVIELTDAQVPKILRDYLLEKAKVEEHCKKGGVPVYFYSTVSFSMIEETKPIRSPYQQEDGTYLAKD